MTDRHHEALAVAVLFFVLTWLSVGLRVYVRGVMRNTWGKDDSFMVATLAIYTVYLAFQFVSIKHGIGRHRSELSEEDNRTALLFWYLGELLYVVISCTLKFSIGFFYLRIAVQQSHVWIIRLLMSSTIFFSVIYLFLVMGQCRPISEFWNNHPASDKCIPPGPTLGITYALAAVNAIADWGLGILPFFIVHGTGMDIKTKVLVVGILAFAAVGSTGTVVRMFYLHKLLDGPDFLWSNTDVAIWSTVEPGIGITAGSIATLRPLMQQCLVCMGHVSSSGQPPSPIYLPRRKDRRGYHRSLGFTDLILTQDERTTSVEISTLKSSAQSKSPSPSNVAQSIENPFMMDVSPKQ